MAKKTRRGKHKQHTPNIGRAMTNIHRRNQDKPQFPGSSVRTNQWKNKHRFGDGSIEGIDLQATGDAMKTMSITTLAGKARCRREKICNAGSYGHTQNAPDAHTQWKIQSTSRNAKDQERQNNGSSQSSN
jgi:hypothetical protein